MQEGISLVLNSMKNTSIRLKDELRMNNPNSLCFNFEIFLVYLPKLVDYG